MQIIIPSIVIFHRQVGLNERHNNTETDKKYFHFLSLM